MLKCEMLKPCSLFPLQKLGTRLLSYVKLKLPDDDCRGQGYDSVWSEIKTIDFTSLKYHDRVQLV